MPSIVQHLFLISWARGSHASPRDPAWPLTKLHNPNPAPKTLRNGKANCYLPHYAFCIETDSGRAVQPASAVTPLSYRQDVALAGHYWSVRHDSLCGELKPWTACMKQQLWEIGAAAAPLGGLAHKPKTPVDPFS